jgi:hypothetical protein
VPVTAGTGHLYWWYRPMTAGFRKSNGRGPHILVQTPAGSRKLHIGREKNILENHEMLNCNNTFKKAF